MSCDKYLELLSARLDGALTEDEERELEEHLAACPACRAAGAQLAALQGAFDALEDIPAPEGFAEGVMERIRAAETEKKVVPLFKRPRFRALAGLAACAVLAVGLYGTAYSQRKSADEKDFNMAVRSFNRDAVIEFTDDSACEALPGEGAAACPEPGASPEGPEDGLVYESQKCAPDSYMDRAMTAAPMVNRAVLTLDCLPEGEGMEELLLLEAYASPDEEGHIFWVSGEKLKQVEQLANEQGITASVTSNAEEAEEFIIIVLNGTK